MGYYDQPFDYKTARNAKEANEAVDRFRRSKKPTPMPKPTQYEQPFDHRKAQQAKASMKPNFARPAPAPAAPPKPVGPSVASRAGSAAKVTGKALTRPIAGVGLGTAAKFAGARVAGLAGAAMSIPGAVAIPLAYAAGDSLKDTETAQALQRPVTDAMASMTGLDDLQQRMISNDPAVSAAAVDEYRASNPIARPGTAPAPAGAPAPAAPPAAPVAPVAPVTDPQGESAPAQTPYATAPGNPDILTRPGTKGREFTDAATVTGLARPGQTPQELAAEQAKVDAARQNYVDNTTGRDGRVYLGGPEAEKLAALQAEQALKGQNTAVITRQLNEQGLTPEQRAAYAADPAGAYQVDATANASSAKAQLDAFKYQQTQQRNATTDARLVRTAAVKEKSEALKAFESYPDIHQQLSAMADEQFNPESGETMSSTVQRLLSSFELDGGIPQLDENGRLVQRKQEQAAAGAPEIDAFF